MTYVVIDPGKTGGAVIFEGCVPLEGYAMEAQGFGIDVGGLKDILAQWQGLYQWDSVWIEMPTPRPRQSSHSTAVQFYVIGQTQAAVFGMGADSLHMVNPSTWTAFTKRLSSRVTDKAKVQAQELCHKYFPDFVKDWIPQTKIHDGVADCLAISLYINRDVYVDDIEDRLWLKS